MNPTASGLLAAGALTRDSLTAPADAEDLCERYADRVYRFAALIARGGAEAEDLAHDALIKAIRGLGRFDPARGSVEAWLWRIVLNVARDAGIMKRRQFELLSRLRSQSVAEPATAPPLQLPDEQLVAAVRALPSRDRALIALRFGADLDYADVGTALGMSTAAAGVATRRALHQLRIALENRDGE
jgi:RNA polymerase sigma factor (sigma-70 family)